MEKLNHISLSFKCPKAFNELQPCEGGWYCNGCHKLVHDLRGKQETEILDTFAANDYKLCGLFEADRIRVNPPLPKWRKWAAAAVLTLGFTGLHQALMAQKLSKTDSLALTETKAEKSSTIDTGDELFGVVSENSCEYPGGIEKFHRYVNSRIVPDASASAGKKVFMIFDVGKDGSVSNARMLKGSISKKMEKQLVGIIESSKCWKPGQQNGRAVKQSFALPIVFNDPLDAVK